MDIFIKNVLLVSDKEDYKLYYQGLINFDDECPENDVIFQKNKVYNGLL